MILLSVIVVIITFPFLDGYKESLASVMALSIIFTIGTVIINILENYGNLLNILKTDYNWTIEEAWKE